MKSVEVSCHYCDAKWESRVTRENDLNYLEILDSECPKCRHYAENLFCDLCETPSQTNIILS